MDNYQIFRQNWEAKVKRQGHWSPPITEKQETLARFREKYILASGPRHSTKTVGTLHALARHAWDIPDASVAFISISQTNATDGGAWLDLTNSVLPEWVAGDFGMKWIEKPRATTYTHKSYCVVSNQFGGQSRIQLYSLSDEKDVEDLFKGKTFTMIYITELSKFRHLKTFIILKDSLRGIGRPEHHFKFLADTNPADEGTESWIWQLWYKPLELAERNEYQSQFRLLEFSLADNHFYSEDRKAEIRQSYEYDVELYQRMIEGKWIRVSDGSFFQDVFHKYIHVQPDDPADDMVLQDGCSHLLTGTDIGSGINHAAHIIEPFWHQGRKCYKILDEIISVGLEVGIEEFTKMIAERMDFWEKQATSRIRWEHWSDADAFTFSSAAKEYKHRIVFAASKGRIELRAADKGPGSVMPRLSLLKQLFFEDRLYINAKCVKTIEAFRNLKKVDSKRMVSRSNPIDPRDPYKHPIDSLSYAILMDVGEEAHTSMMVNTRSSMPTEVIHLNV